MKDAWDPKKYLEFEKEREKPFYDLMKMVVPKGNMHILDLGSGTGKLTEILHDDLRAKSTLGIDSSKEMLKCVPTPKGGLKFKLEHIQSFQTQEKFDLIFSNAALQWVEDHEYLFEKYSKMLKKGGQLAVQVPSNFAFPTHTIALQLALEHPFKEALKNAKHPSVLTIEEYSTLLYRLGAKEQLVRAEIYPLTLESVNGAIAWVSGSLMTLYRSHLSPGLYQQFLNRYSERLEEHFGNGPVFIPFKRLLMWAKFYV